MKLNRKMILVLIVLLTIIGFLSIMATIAR